MQRLTLALSFSLLLSIGAGAASGQLPSVQPPQTAPPTSRPGTAPPATTPPPVGAPAIAMPGQTGKPPAGMPRDLAIYAGLQGASTQNVQLVIKISDSFTSEVQTTKVVTMLVADYQSGQIRSSGGGGEGLINIDARPQIHRDGRIRLQVTVEYRPDLTPEQYDQLVKSARGGLRITMLTESLTLMVADGKPTLISQSSDPRSDRKVSVEVTATIVK